MAFERAILTNEHTADGYTVHDDNLQIDGVTVATGEVAATLAAAGNVKRDLIVVDKADGSVSVISSAEVAEEDEDEIVLPSLSAGQVVLGSALVDDTAVGEVDHGLAGLDGDVSADE